MDEERLVIAVDGGQTGTSCLIGDTDGNILASGRGGSAALAGHSQLRDLMRAALDGAVGGALAALPHRPRSVAACYLSLTGGIQESLELLPELVHAESVRAESDTFAALASGTLAGPGVVLLAGTGAVALSVDEIGKESIHGGWGYLLGDEGSGHWFGLEAVRAAARADDARSEEAAWIREALDRIGARDAREAAARIYGGSVGRAEVASLCPIVLAAARAGESLARAIVAEGAERLFALLTSTCANAGGLERRRIVLTGGVLHAGSPVRDSLERRIHSDLPAWEIVYPVFPPVVGALFMALRLCGVSITDEIVNNITRTLGAVPADHVKGHHPSAGAATTGRPRKD